MGRIVYSVGDLATDLRLFLRGLKANHASDFHKKAAQGMEKLGYAVSKNVLVENRGDGRRGRIDIVAKRDKELVAMELDHVKARKKSIFKVQYFSGATLRLVVCRFEPAWKTREQRRC